MCALDQTDVCISAKRIETLGSLESKKTVEHICKSPEPDSFQKANEKFRCLNTQILIK